MPKQLFGTDGIRGRAGEAPLDPATVFCFGLALGRWAVRRAPEEHLAAPRIVLGMDTRESGPWLARTVAAGLRASGVEPAFAGVTTTPGVAYLTRTGDFVAGVMISASHNPFEDNGLKVFGHSGFKLADDDERELEREIAEMMETAGKEAREAPLEADAELDHHYLDSLARTCVTPLDGLRLVLDCANGSASALGGELFGRLGAAVTAIGAEPDGRNINLGCGALHVERLRERVLALGADAGAAFDGDADRCILVSRSGRIVGGGHTLLVAARALRPPAVVATVMSNLGLERALEAEGIGLTRTAVGDKYVLEEMLRAGLPLGGEQSGHVIFRRWATTGDGLLTALRVLERSRQTGLGLDELVDGFTVYPQLLVNVRFRVKRPLEELGGVQAEIRAAEEEFGALGRVLVRFSGTEPLARVMVEGPSQARVEARAHAIANAIGAALC
jgi:phosphoglucosamine mutase